MREYRTGAIPPAIAARYAVRIVSTAAAALRASALNAGSTSAAPSTVLGWRPSSQALVRHSAPPGPLP